MNDRLKRWGWLAVFAALPAMAQDETPADAPPAEDAEAVAEPAPAEATPAEDAAATESTDSAAPAEDSSSESVAADESSADESSESSDQGGGLGLNLYVGLEYDMTTVDVDAQDIAATLGASRRLDSDFYKVRLGARLFEAVGVELQAGFPANDASADELETKSFYGVYLVPTGTLFELFEVSARLGYAFTKVEGNGGGSENLDGASYGVALELPLRALGESMPNLRFSVGGTVYQQDREARIYGWHGGLRYDFSL